MSDEGEIPYTSFEREVWQTLRNVDVDAHIQQLNAGYKSLDYLSWASAWAILMEHYPESNFEFDELKTYDNGSCEVWVTVRIIDGNRHMNRRWWLPVMQQTKKGPAAVANPTSLQVNNCRMRCLTKCLATCGLGTDIYIGEDVVENTGQTVGKKSTSVASQVLEDVVFSEEQLAVINEMVTKGNNIAPDAESIDQDAAVAYWWAMRDLDSDVKVAISRRLPSYLRSNLKTIGRRIIDEEREDALNGDADE